MPVPRRWIAVGAAVLAYMNLIWALWNLVAGLLSGYGTQFALRTDLVYLALATLGGLGAYVGLRRGVTFGPARAWLVVAVVVVGMLAGLLNVRAGSDDDGRELLCGLPYPWLLQRVAPTALDGEVDSRWQVLLRGVLVDLAAWVVAGYGVAAITGRAARGEEQHVASRW